MTSLSWKNAMPLALNVPVGPVCTKSPVSAVVRTADWPGRLPPFPSGVVYIRGWRESVGGGDGVHPGREGVGAVGGVIGHDDVADEAGCAGEAVGRELGARACVVDAE